MKNVSKNISFREKMRLLRHVRIRKSLVGSSDRPRVYIHRSLKNIYVQLIDDTTQKVLMGMSTLNGEVKTKVKSGGNVDGAKALGAAFAQEAMKKGFKKVCFDRGGYKYHGRVKAFAEAAREKGMEF